MATDIDTGRAISVGSYGQAGTVLSSLAQRLMFQVHALRHGVVAFPSAPSAWLLAASLAFASLTSLRVPGLSHVSYCDLLFVLAAIVGIIERLVVRDFVYEKSTVIAAVVYIVCLLGFMASYVINYKNPATLSYVQGFNYNLNFFSFVYGTVVIPLAVFSVRIRSLAEFRFIILAWTIGALYGGLYVIAYINGFISHYDYYWVHFGRAAGLTTQPNVLGFNILLALPGLLILWYHLRSWLLKGLVVVGFIVVWKTVDYTGSRSAIGGFVAMFVMYLVMYGRNKIGRATIAVVLLVFAEGVRSVLAVLLKGDFRHGSALARILGVGTSYSDGVRDLLNSGSYHVWVDNPLFGAGYNYLRQAHNLYLQILAVSGVVGLIGLIVALGMPLFFLLANRTERSARPEAAAFFAAIVMLLAMAWVQPGLEDMNTAVVFGLALYLALNAYFCLGANRDSGSYPQHVATIP